MTKEEGEGECVVVGTEIDSFLYRKIITPEQGLAWAMKKERERNVPNNGADGTAVLVAQCRVVEAAVDRCPGDRGWDRGARAKAP
jgi:hypothetical protein